MCRIRKILSLVLFLAFVVSSLIIAKPEQTSAQTTNTPIPQVTASLNPTSSPTPTPISTLTPTPTIIYPKPLIPEFTVKLISSLPEINKSTIELTIKNQPFDNNGTDHYSFVYDVRIIDIDGNWRNFYNAEDGYPTRSNSSYTVFSYSLEKSAYYPSNPTTLGSILIPIDGNLTFQVRAMIGFRDRGIYSNGVMPYVFKGETSDWSNTQTITVGEISSSPTPTPTVPELSWLVILPLTLSILFIAVYLKTKRLCRV